MLRREKLFRLKLKAKRSGIWFRALSQIERALFNITTKVVDEVHSLRLAEALFSIAKKLEGAFENGVLRAVNEFGFPRARELSLYAQKRGNIFAKKWASDICFAKFSVVMYIHDLGLIICRKECKS